MTSPIKIANDPRFKLARTLLSTQETNDGKSGPESSIEIFATLLEECRTSMGETSLDAALCQYEYGNALFRAVLRRAPLEDDEAGENKSHEQDDKYNDGDKKPAAVKSKSVVDNQREIMAAAAEKRTRGAAVTEDDDTSPPGNKKAKIETKIETEKNEHDKQNDAKVKARDGEYEENISKNEEEEEDQEEEDDVDLALEMMETSFAILESHVTNNSNDKDNENSTSHANAKENDKLTKEQESWALGQLPRILTGIADAHSFRQQFGNAVDAYCRALPYREKAWEEMKKLNQHHGQHQQLSGDEEAMLTVDHLECQRHLVETYALVAETLLNCPDGEDVVCYYDAEESDEGYEEKKASVAKSSEVKNNEDRKLSAVLVKAEERVNFARSHYEMAREGLEEIVYRMGKMAAAKKDLGSEKQDICYLVTMLVGIGNVLTEAES